MSILATPKAPSAKKAVAHAAPVANIVWLAVEELEPNPFQYRRTFGEDELRELAASIEAHGVLEPVIVRPIGGKKSQGILFQLVAGERRWRASMLAHQTHIPAVVRDLTDFESSELALIENSQREDPDDWAIAEGLRSHMALSAENGDPLSELRLAKRIGKSEGYVRNHLGLFKLRPSLQEVAKAHNNVKSSLFEIQKIKDAEIERELIAELEGGAPFTRIRDRVARVLSDEKWKEESDKPDASTQRAMKGRNARAREAKKEIEAALAAIEGHLVTAELWRSHINESDHKNLMPRVQKLKLRLSQFE